MKLLIQSAAIAAITTFLCFPIALKAQSAEQDTLWSLEMEELIITASKYKQDPQMVGRNVTVISNEEIQRSIYSSVADILDARQSIQIIGNGQTPGSLQQGFIRHSRMLVMIDGVRISDPSTPGNSIDLSELSVTGIKRIEIVRGSHSTLYGSSAIGGVINIITKKKGSTGFNANISTTHGALKGSYLTSNSLFANYTFESGWYTNVGVFQEYSGGFDATIDTLGSATAFNPQDRDSFQKIDVTGKIGFNNERYNFFVSYRRIGQKVEADVGAFNDDGNAYTDFNRELFSYQAGVDLSTNLSLQFNGAYSDLHRQFVNDSSVVNKKGMYDGDYVETNAYGRLWKNELRAVYQANNIQVIGGLSASVQTMNVHSYTYIGSQFGVFESESNLDSLNLNQTIYAGYLHTNLNGRLVTDHLNSLSLILGVRYLHHNTFGSHLTYEISPQYRLSESSIIYAALTTGFNAPSLYQLHSPNTASGYYTNRGNPALQPETSITYELGWKQRVNEAFSFEVALFNTQVDNVIEYVYLWESSAPIDKLIFSDYRGDTYINLSHKNILGIELKATARLGAILLDGSISYIISELTFSPNDIDGSVVGNNYVQVYENGQFVNSQTEIEGLSRRPAFTASVDVTYLVANALYFQVESHFTGSRDDVFYAANLGPFGALGRSRLNSYNITNVSAHYRFNDHFSVTGKVENIFNSDYTELIGYQTRGRAFFVELRYEL